MKINIAIGNGEYAVQLQVGKVNPYQFSLPDSCMIAAALNAFFCFVVAFANAIEDEQEDRAERLQRNVPRATVVSAIPTAWRRKYQDGSK